MPKTEAQRRQEGQHRVRACVRIMTAL